MSAIEAALAYGTRADLQRDYDAHLLPGKARFYDALGVNFTLGRREGVWFEDAYSGRRFINCHCNGGVFNLGHRNPGVTAAVREALESVDTMLGVYGSLLKQLASAL